MLLDAVHAFNQYLIGFRESLDDLALCALIGAGDHDNHVAFMDLHY